MAPHFQSPDSPPNGVTQGFGMASDRNAIPEPPAPASEKPNILYIMADQLAAPLLSIHDKDSPIKTPNIEKLAQSGVVFENAYCNSPLCAPSRFCMVSGQLPHRIKAYDNASTLPSDIPTYAHYLRLEGYQTVLAGKMHFIGADQLHGYEERLTPDIYPGDFGWSVNWDKPDEHQEWYHNMSSVFQAGPCARTNQLDFDEETMYKSTQFIYDHVRQGPKKRPFCLTVSLTHPHDPYAMTEDYWDLYEDTEIPLPKTNIPDEEQDPHSIRIMKAVEKWKTHLPEESIKRARRAYYGACSYVDDQIGKLMTVLKRCRLDKNTIVIFSGDHGDMLGERGLWYKMSWFENSARVPLIVNYPAQYAPRRVSQNVSTMDLLPTLVEMVGSKVSPHLNLDGRSFYGALTGASMPKHIVYGEYMGEGTISPLCMIKEGRYKYVTCLTDPPQLFDLEEDKREIKNLCESSDPVHKELAAQFAEKAKVKWDLQAMHDDTLYCQRQRLMVHKALKQGRFTPWDFTPVDDGAYKYIRSTIPLDDLERKARYPIVDSMGRDPLLSYWASHHGAAGAAGQ